MEADLLRELFLPFAQDESDAKNKTITKTDLFLMGLSGTDKSSEKRKALCRTLGLPGNLSSNAFLDALNMLYDKEYIDKIMEKL